MNQRGSILPDIEAEEDLCMRRNIWMIRRVPCLPDQKQVNTKPNLSFLHSPVSLQQQATIDPKDGPLRAPEFVSQSVFH